MHKFLPTKMIAKLYRKIFPSRFRDKIYKKFLGRLLFFFRHFKTYTRAYFTLIFGFILPKSEKNKIYAFIGKHGYSAYPYPFILPYKKMDIPVLTDDKWQLPYVMHYDKKLYFPKEFSKEKIIYEYRNLIIEQDLQSPHCYIEKKDILKDKTLLDIGSADGNFVLNNIEIIKFAYLFECEEIWERPLAATFEPWKNKIAIIKKYVGDKTHDNFIKIDDFVKENALKDLFVKMDIEGAEIAALKGAADTLTNNDNVTLSICTYHRKTDAKDISLMMDSFGFNYSFSNGYMFWNGNFCKGIIRCTK